MKARLKKIQILEEISQDAGTGNNPLNNSWNNSKKQQKGIVSN